MSRNSMRKFLRKPKSRSDDREADVAWDRLYQKALQRAEATNDPRVKDLVHFKSDPEQALRRLSVTSEVDLKREFPGR